MAFKSKISLAIQKSCRGCTCFFPELEEEITEWILEKRQSGFSVSTTVICSKAKLLHKKEMLQVFKHPHLDCAIDFSNERTFGGQLYLKSYRVTFKTS